MLPRPSHNSRVSAWMPSDRLQLHTAQVIVHKRPGLKTSESVNDNRAFGNTATRLDIIEAGALWSTKNSNALRSFKGRMFHYPEISMLNLARHENNGWLLRAVP